MFNIWKGNKHTSSFSKIRIYNFLVSCLENNLLENKAISIHSNFILVRSVILVVVDKNGAFLFPCSFKK